MEGEARGDRAEEEKGYGKTRRRGEGEAEGLIINMRGPSQLISTIGSCSSSALQLFSSMEGAVGATITLSVPRRRREPISMKNRSATRTREDRTQLWMNESGRPRTEGGIGTGGVHCAVIIRATRE
ncbi:unnamed protein product [Arctogadus glacialis]